MSGPWSEDERQRAEKHLGVLAKRLKTRVYFTTDPFRWQAHATTAQAWVPEPVGPVEYLVALHELGHIGSKVAREWNHRYSELGVEALVEGAAWAWATMMALPGLVGAMVGEDWVALATYFLGYLRAAAESPPPAKRLLPYI